MMVCPNYGQIRVFSQIRVFYSILLFVCNLHQPIGVFLSTFVCHMWE
jgi:hypothetical protein